MRAESYDNWTTKVRAALEAKGGERMDFVDLKKMFTEASDNKYPESELLEALQLTVEVRYSSTINYFQALPQAPSAQPQPSPNKI